jgi:hypothetical protein
MRQQSSYSQEKEVDPQKAKRVMEAMIKMKKIVIPTLKQAYEGQ